MGNGISIETLKFLTNIYMYTHTYATQFLIKAEKNNELKQIIRELWLRRYSCGYRINLNVMMLQIKVTIMYLIFPTMKNFNWKF